MNYFDELVQLYVQTKDKNKSFLDAQNKEMEAQIKLKKQIHSKMNINASNQSDDDVLTESEEKVLNLPKNRQISKRIGSIQNLVDLIDAILKPIPNRLIAKMIKKINKRSFILFTRKNTLCKKAADGRQELLEAFSRRRPSLSYRPAKSLLPKNKKPVWHRQVSRHLAQT